jgi:hypothetical protein
MIDAPNFKNLRLFFNFGENLILFHNTLRKGRLQTVPVPTETGPAG